MPMLNAINDVHHMDNPRHLDPIGIAIHHTVTRMRPDASEAQERTHIKIIDQYHLDQGFGGFGYHAIVFPSGRSYECGNIDLARAHVAQRNHQLIGVALVGDFSNSLPEILQLEELGNVLNAIDPSETLPIHGHKHWAVAGWGTECPGALHDYDFGRLRHAPGIPPFTPSLNQIAHALAFAYTGYYLGKPDTLQGTDRHIPAFLDRSYSGPDPPFQSPSRLTRWANQLERANTSAKLLDYPVDVSRNRQRLDVRSWGLCSRREHLARLDPPASRKERIGPTWLSCRAVPRRIMLERDAPFVASGNRSPHPKGPLRFALLQFDFML